MPQTRVANQITVGRTSTDLPPPKRDPIDLEDESIFGRRRPEVRAWIQERVGKGAILYLARPRTRVDVGHWLTNGRLWVLAGNREIILLALGKRPFAERVDFSQLEESLYNHLTGELVLAPANELTVKTLRVGPLEGLQLLAQIFHNFSKDKG